jgi:DNA polymerase III alpha subunit (gram-positive type)
MDALLVKESTDLAVQMQGVRVTDRASADVAADYIAAGKGMVRKIKDFFAPLKRSQDEAKQRLLDAERAELGKIEPAVGILTRALTDWRIEQERIRREAEDKARRQEEERRRLEREALAKADEAARKNELEQKRIDQEAAARALAAKNREIAEKIEKKRREDQEALNAKAKSEQDEILDKAAAEESRLAPIAPVPEKIVNTAASTLRDNWVLEVDKESDIPREYCVPDWPRLNKLAKVEKDKLRIPGVRAVNKPVLATRLAGK